MLIVNNLIFRKKIPPVIPVFESLYRRIVTINVNPLGELEIFNIFTRMLTKVSSDSEFKALTQLTNRRIVLPIDRDHNLNVDKEGTFYSWMHGHDPAGIDFFKAREDLDQVVSDLSSHLITPDRVRGSILDYVRFGPHNDLYSLTENNSCM